MTQLKQEGIEHVLGDERLPAELKSRQLKSDLHALLEYNRLQYHMEYRGKVLYCSINLLQRALSTMQRIVSLSSLTFYRMALVSLQQMGAGTQRMKEFFEEYSRNLEPAIGSQGIINETNWTYFLGQKRYFADYRDFFAKWRKKVDSIDSLVQKITI